MISLLYSITRFAGKVVGLFAVATLLTATGFFGYTKYVFQSVTSAVLPSPSLTMLPSGLVATSTNPFPVSVDSVAMEINEDPALDGYIEATLGYDPARTEVSRLMNRMWREIAKLSWYQNLASSISRVVVIYPGERREEVVDNIGDVLRWNDDERAAFAALVVESVPTLEDGKFYPGRYVVEVGSSPARVAELLNARFATEILSRYDAAVAAQVPLDDALTIASLLEREAYDFTDMRIISGIIWNRLFIDMPLQLDATLQYARGVEGVTTTWWPKVVPDDKFIDSPYNTYEIPGLPPAPIANPSVEAVVAALNPRATECYFYFHDVDGKFYCTKTYEEHVAKLKEIYGQGR